MYTATGIALLPFTTMSVYNIYLTMIISKKSVGTTSNQNFTNFFVSKFCSHHQGSSVFKNQYVFAWTHTQVKLQRKITEIIAVCYSGHFTYFVRPGD